MKNENKRKKIVVRNNLCVMFFIPNHNSCDISRNKIIGPMKWYVKCFRNS